MVRIKLEEDERLLFNKIDFNTMANYHSTVVDGKLVDATFIWKLSNNKAETITMHPGEIFEYDENNLDDWRVITNEEQDIHTED